MTQKWPFFKRFKNTLKMDQIEKSTFLLKMRKIDFSVFHEFCPVLSFFRMKIRGIIFLLCFDFSHLYLCLLKKMIFIFNFKKVYLVFWVWDDVDIRFWEEDDQVFNLLVVMKLNKMKKKKKKNGAHKHRSLFSKNFASKYSRHVVLCKKNHNQTNHK